MKKISFPNYHVKTGPVSYLKKLGESNKFIYDEMNYEERKKHYTEFMKRAKKKLPGIRFIDKLVGTKYLKKGGKSNLMEHHITS